MFVKDIFEGISDILYHSTSLRTTLNILKENRFRLTPDFGTQSELELRSKNKIYYMSFSRSKINSFHYPSSRSSILVIDGSQLKRDGISGKPVDYWGPEYEKSEMEDRIFYDKPYIENSNKYIKEIHTYVSEDDSDFYDQVRKAYILSKKLGISFFLYDNKETYTLLDKRKSIKVSSLNFKKKEKNTPYVRFPRNDFAVYMELLSVNDEEKLSKKAKDKLYRIRYDSFGDVQRSLSADIHNEKNGSNRENLDKFLKKVLSLKLNNVQDILDLIREKFN